jgi:hypothetical protein
MSLNKIIEPSKSGSGWQKVRAPFKVLGELSKDRNREHDPQGPSQWVAKGDVVAEARFIAKLFAIAA